MANKFIHARMSESGSANGKKGDQTGGEVAITNYSNHKLGWISLKAYNPTLIDWMIYYGKKLANNPCIGYGQNDRLSLYNELVKCNWIVDNLNTPCNTDCSAFIRVLIVLACKRMGINKTIPNFTTVNEKSVLLNTGLFYVNTSNISKSILVTKSKGHTVLCYDDSIDQITKKSIHEIALECIRGTYGNGSTRQKNIESLGYNYKEIQTEVNKILGGK